MADFARPRRDPRPSLANRKLSRASLFALFIAMLALTAAVPAAAQNMFSSRFMASEMIRGPGLPAIVDLDGDGILDLVVTAINGNELVVMRGRGDGRFQPGVGFPTRPGPAGVALGDVNNDGKLDVAIANAGDNSVSIMLGNGNGSFGQRFDYPVGLSPNQVELGRINGDGNLDLVTCNPASNNLTRMFGNGDGTFGGRIDFGPQAYAIKLLDLDGDAKLDLLAFNGSGMASYLGDGLGQFVLHAGYATGPGPGLPAVALLNADAIPDVAVPNGPGTVSVLLGDGAGGFAPRVPYALRPNCKAVAADDLNGDGFPDLVLTEPGGFDQYANGIVSVLLGTGTGAFGPVNEFIAGGSSQKVAAADFNGDGRADVLVVNTGPGGASYSAQNLNVMFGHSDGTIGSKREFATGTAPNAITTGDLNADGEMDVVTGNLNTVSVLLGTGNATLGSPTNLPGPGKVYSVALTDLNGDSRLDLVAAAYDTSVLAVRLGNGDGTFGALQRLVTAAHPLRVLSQDLNGDGKMDLVAACELGAAVSVFMGDGSGGFAPRVDYPDINLCNDVALADLNGDGRLDMVTISSQHPNHLSVRLGQPNGTFGARSDMALSLTVESVTLGDFTGDGKIDAAIVLQYDSQVAIFPGRGDGSFDAAFQRRETGPYPQVAGAADLNGDGRLDLVTSNKQANDVSVYFGGSTGLPLSRTDFGTHRDPTDVAFADFDKDGLPDIAVACLDSSRVAILLQAVGSTLSVGGTGSPSPGLRYLRAWPAPAASDVHVAFDLPRAGRVEAVVLDVSGRQVRVLEHGERLAGPQSLRWDRLGDHGQALAAGLYFIRVRSGGETGVARVVTLQ